MFLLQLIRIALATLCGFIGYYIAYALLPERDTYFIRDFPQIVITVLAIIYGYFGLPYAFGEYRQKVINWLFNFIRSIIGDTLQDFYSRVAQEVNGNPSRAREKKAPAPANTMVLDTSALIDGRISTVAKTGFLFGTFVVPQFVIAELRFLADSPDTLKRQRARRGLELLNELKKMKSTKEGVSVKIVANDYEKVKKVDDKLMKLCKTLKSSLVTTDYNLNKNAQAQGIKVLNVNELVNAVKLQSLPGEQMHIRVVQQGKEKGQGVGYLEDGTMVVVEGGEEQIGNEINVEISRIIQTNAGRMLFTQFKNA